MQFEICNNQLVGCDNGLINILQSGRKRCEWPSNEKFADAVFDCPQVITLLLKILSSWWIWPGPHRGRLRPLGQHVFCHVWQRKTWRSCLVQGGHYMGRKRIVLSWALNVFSNERLKRWLFIMSLYLYYLLFYIVIDNLTVNQSSPMPLPTYVLIINLFLFCRTYFNFVHIL